MSWLRIDNEEKQLDRLFRDVAKMPEDEIKSHMAKYLCIQVSGYLENVIKELVYEFHRNTCKKETSNFVASKIKNLTNLDEKKINKFLHLFNSEWTEAFLSGANDQHLSALNTIISQRHLIAHGGGSRSNITYRSINLHYESIKELVSILKSIVTK